jgi:hypothetical protein
MTDIARDRPALEREFAPPRPRPWIERVVASPAVRSSYLSLAAHLSIGILLALAMLDPALRRPQRPLRLSFGEAREAIGDDPAAPVAIGPLVTDAAEEMQAEEEVPAAMPLVAAAPDIAVEPPTGEPDTGPGEPAADAAAAATDAAIGPAGGGRAGGRARTVSLTPGVPRSAAGGGAASAGEPFAPRRAATRGATARARGGSLQSEAAVERGLEWLARHQCADGSWRFDLAGCRCDGGCRNPGTLTSTTASTAIALLPFLGAGHTHQDGRHQEVVSRGIYYLLSRMERTPRGADLTEGTMYGHGVSTLALAEALGMTRDEALVGPVRDAVRFIETAQDLHGGGWRYLPGQPGDTTVTAWQVTALKSAQLCGLEAPSPTFAGACRFLDSVQSLEGAAYGYRSPAARPCTSAIGLLCRMYTGWSAEREPLRRGLTMLAKPGPAPQAIYMNFYLSQALMQANHPLWPRWNVRNRDQIVTQQARTAHETGSWFFADQHTAPGGRLAHTALAVLTLEVYYRLLPIYGQEAVAGGF